MATEYQSEVIYVSLSLISKTFEKIERNCLGQVERGDEFMNSNAAVILQKLEQFNVLVNKKTARFALAIDPRYKTDILNDGHVLRAFVTLTGSFEYETVCNPFRSKWLLIEDIMDEHSVDLNEDDKTARFMRTKLAAGKGRKPLMRWNGNSDRFPYIAQAASRVMAAQATTLENDFVFCTSGNFLDAERCLLSDDWITDCMWVRAWGRLL